MEALRTERSTDARRTHRYSTESKLHIQVLSVPHRPLSD